MKPFKTTNPIALRLLASSVAPIALFLSKHQLSKEIRRSSFLCHLLFRGGKMELSSIKRVLNSLSKLTLQELLNELVVDGIVTTEQKKVGTATYIYYSVATTEEEKPIALFRPSRGCEVTTTIDPSLVGAWKPQQILKARDKDAAKQLEAKAQKELLQRLEEREKEKKSRKSTKPKLKTKSRVKRSTKPKTSDRLKSTTKAKTKVKAKVKPKVANQDKSKRQAAEAALDRLIAIGKPFTIKEWAAQAGCTDAMLYKPRHRDLLEKARSFTFASASKMGDLLQALEELKQENRPITPREVTNKAGVSRHIFHRGHYDEIRESLDQWNSQFDPIEWNPRTKQIHDRLEQSLKELVEIGEVFTLSQWAERAEVSLNTIRSEYHSDLKQRACEEIDRLRQVHGPAGLSQISKGRKALERSLDYLVSLGKPFTIKKWAEMSGFSATLVYADSVADLLAKAKEANDQFKSGRKANNVVEIDTNQNKESAA